MDFFISLLAIVAIDLVLAGDNAIVIGMAARNLPAEQQKRAILWGTAGAIVIRAISTVVVVWLLGLTGLKLAGGLLLIWIALKLLIENSGDGHKLEAGASLMKAVTTIVIADTAMGLDNVLAVAGAAHGDFVLVLVGLIISIPIMVFGSTMVLRLMVRFPWLIYVGSGILAWTAGKMIVGESFVADALDGSGGWKYAVEALVIAGTLYAGYAINRRRAQQRKRDEAQRIGEQESGSASA